ncbi:hypothetical protein APS_2551 [Acetobacter pasteurianus subsp. pasteurianus LMG 1262 = NBRC 106471]|nr:hypothetical protein APS_2551 [Acetobacter pasteurianus subsp. pasteurianus LMG 1262 = NBRC 106471]
MRNLCSPQFVVDPMHQHYRCFIIPGHRDYFWKQSFSVTPIHASVRIPPQIEHLPAFS